MIGSKQSWLVARGVGSKCVGGKSPWEILVRLVTETKTRPQNFGSLTVDVVVVVALVAREVIFFVLSFEEVALGWQRVGE